MVSNDVSLLTIDAVCERVGLRRSAVYKRVQEGTFPAPVRLSQRCARWRSDAIAEWIERVSSAA